jgi:hypothetical protein
MYDKIQQRRSLELDIRGHWRPVRFRWSISRSSISPKDVSSAARR